MPYMVIGPDGSEYGPADIATLKQWAAENRLQPATNLRDFNSGQIVQASTLTDLFPQPAAAPQTAVATMTPPETSGQWSQPPSYANYPRQVPVNLGQPVILGQDSGTSDVWGSIFRSVIALVFFFVLGGIGVIVGTYALVYGIRAVTKGHKLGWLALTISAVSFIAIVIGWLFRLGVV